MKKKEIELITSWVQNVEKILKQGFELDEIVFFRQFGNSENWIRKTEKERNLKEGELDYFRKSGYVLGASFKNKTKDAESSVFLED